MTRYRLSKASRQFLTSVLVTFGVLASKPVVAYQFWPSEAEWAWWPHYCKARYVDGDLVGAATKFRHYVTAAEIAAARAELGVAVWTPIHHHCAGLILLQRARLAATADERQFALNAARYESTFTLLRIPADSRMYAEILVHLGMIQRTDRDPDGALTFFRQAVDALPSLSGGYLGLALVYRDQGNMGQALSALERGSEATQGKSAEIEYYLGLYYSDLKRFAEARDRAQVAYSLGIQLPALRERLAAAGFPIDDSSVARTSTQQPPE